MCRYGVVLLRGMCRHGAVLLIQRCTGEDGRFMIILYPRQDFLRFCDASARGNI